MANETWNSYCGCTEQVTPCNTVFQKVDELPQLGDATRNHAYILPDNSVWVVNTDGTGYSQLNGGTGGGGATYDDTELRELIQQLKDRNTMEDNRLTNIENLNAKQNERLTAIENKPDDDIDQDDLIPLWQEINKALDFAMNGNQMADDSYHLSLGNDQAIREINRKIEAGEIGGGKTYTAGAGISISDDGVISSTVVDTDTDTDTRNVYRLDKSAKLYDSPKKISEYGAVTKTGSALLINAIKLALPDNVGQAMNNVVLTLPKVNFDINVNGVEEHHELINVTTAAPWLYTKTTSSARAHVYVKTKFGVLKMEFDVSGSNKVVNFEFEFFKVANTNGGEITLDPQEPSLTVPMTIENIMQGEAFGANFYDEYSIKVTMDEPLMALNSLDYNLTLNKVEVVK